MNSLHRTDFTFSIRLTSDLHIGTGEQDALDALRQGGFTEASHLVSLIARDCNEMPVIPATAMKGALRKAHGNVHGEVSAETLFGAAKLTRWKGSTPLDSGGPAQFTLFAGRLDRDASTFPSMEKGESLPYISAQKWSYIATHVTISRDNGAAEKQKLYNLEMVPAGTVFTFEGYIFADVGNAGKILNSLLAPLAGQNGINIGRGTADGAGAAGLVVDSVKLTPIQFDGTSGELVSGAIVHPSIGGEDIERDTVTLELFSRGPFLSLDPSGRNPGSNRNNELRALRRSAGEPVLWPQSIKGVLRERAAWLAALENPEDKEWDERFRKTSTWKSPEDLRPVERLFGVAGWRSQIRVQKLQHKSSQKYAGETGDGWPGIEIDPISGGARDQTLFFHDCYTGVQFFLTLELESRTFDGQSYPLDEDRRLWENLIDEIVDDGLLLGHGVSRGFGWFDVQRKD